LKAVGRIDAGFSTGKFAPAMGDFTQLKKMGRDSSDRQFSLRQAPLSTKIQPWSLSSRRKEGGGTSAIP